MALIIAARILGKDVLQLKRPVGEAAKETRIIFLGPSFVEFGQSKSCIARCQTVSWWASCGGSLPLGAKTLAG